MGKSSPLRVTGSPIQDDRSASRCSSPRRSRRARASRALFVLGADRQASLREWGEVILNDPAEVSLGMRRSEEHTSELQSLMRTSYAVFCLKKKNTRHIQTINTRM